MKISPLESFSQQLPGVDAQSRSRNLTEAAFAILAPPEANVHYWGFPPKTGALNT